MKPPFTELERHQTGFLIRDISLKAENVCSQGTAGETIEYFEYERLCKPSLFTTKLRLHVFCLNERLFDNSLKPIPALRKIFLNKNLKH